MARCRECHFKISKSMEYCPQCGLRDPAGYNVQAHDETKVRKRSKLFPLLTVGAITIIAVVYASYGTAVRPPASSDATAQKSNDDPEKAALIKTMNDAVAARHGGVMPKTMSKEDLEIAAQAGARWKKKQAAEETKHQLEAMKVKPPPSNGYVEIEWAKEHIKPALRDPDSAVFGDTFFVNDRKSETGYYLPAVCGTVNARNGFGGMTGQKRFVYLIFPNESRLALEGSVPDATLVQFWNRFCAGSHD
jgi:hypothetical protein